MLFSPYPQATKDLQAQYASLCELARGFGHRQLFLLPLETYHLTWVALGANLSAEQKQAISERALDLLREEKFSGINFQVAMIIPWMYSLVALLRPKTEKDFEKAMKIMRIIYSDNQLKQSGIEGRFFWFNISLAYVIDQLDSKRLMARAGEVNSHLTSKPIEFRFSRAGLVPYDSVVDLKGFSWQLKKG